jgi:ATP-dependent Lhr-like helicase
VLAQQIIAEVSAQEWSEQALLACSAAPPYAALDENHYQALLRMLAEGYNGRQGIRSAYLHRDAVTRTCAAAVAPADRRDQRRHHSRQRRLQRVAGTPGLNIGSVNEDFAVESIAGDIFQLGNTSYRILRVEPARCGSRMPMASRRPFRSGSARHRGAATNCRPPWRACRRNRRLLSATPATHPA